MPTRTPSTSTLSPAEPAAADDARPVPQPPGPDLAPRVRAFVPEYDLASLSLDELSTSDVAYNRELSWLDFNWRVFAEAQDERNPLLERLKFVAITASNLDEFFRKRVGGLRRQKAAGIAHLNLPGWTPDLQLQLIAKAVRPMVDQQAACLHDQILPALAEYGVRVLDYSELDAAQQQWLRAYYLREVYPILTPLAVDPAHWRSLLNKAVVQTCTGDKQEAAFNLKLALKLSGACCAVFMVFRERAGWCSLAAAGHCGCSGQAVGQH